RQGRRQAHRPRLPRGRQRCGAEALLHRGHHLGGRVPLVQVRGMGEVNFDTAFHALLGHEGGYADHPKDPGGATCWGVTERVARATGYSGHMRDLPVDLAKAIYRRDYWDAVHANEMPEGVRYAVFDAAVNSGVKQAVKWLQRAVG